MVARKSLCRFLFPSPTPGFLIRVSLVALSAYLLFGHLLIPVRIKGGSMEPTYHSGGVNFCWRLRYLLSRPERFDVVMVRLAGNKVMLLKRVVALAGETVEFRDGRLFVDGARIEEPYVRYPCRWNLPPRRVEKGCVYLVGDNRSMPIENHVFGQASIKRIIGGPLW
ncbi:MAG: signal peptidase I [Deltaproteobacteria bacterium]|nr:signal peptidase I [Deltaproteobacteria bacterium]